VPLHRPARSSADGRPRPEQAAELRSVDRGADPTRWGRWLLVRRQILSPDQIQAGNEPELAYYLCAGPPDTTDEDLIRVAGTRWAIEECFQTAKTEVGLDHYQVHRYDAWYRHITLAMLARAYLPVNAAIAPIDLAAASSRSLSARSAVSWNT
jgi:SRSO17 transposase